MGHFRLIKVKKALHGGEWFISCLDPGKEPRYRLNRRLGGLQRWAGLLEMIKFLSLPGFEPSTVHTIA
jgi:hypothetical protein